MEVGFVSVIGLEYERESVQSEQREEVGMVLRVMEEEEVEIRCTADHGYPGHTFVWTGPAHSMRRARNYMGERMEEERWAGNISHYGEVTCCEYKQQHYYFIFAGHPFLRPLHPPVQ